ncbi:MAG TPA: DUF4386 domain-containing protein [Devosia sp.]|nr:DUF4386 domain-containing protein [Devosia sp.]
MTSDKKIAVWTGIFFILATAMGVASGILLGPLLGGPDYLLSMSENSSTAMLSTFLNLIMAGAVIAIAIAIYPIINRTNETLAAGYLAARTSEGILLAISGVAWLGLASMGAEFIQAGQPESSHFQTLADLLVSSSTATFTFGANITFGVTALMLNYFFIKTNLVPRIISIWGFVGGALILILGSMKILGLPISSIEVAFTVPIALNEMVLAIWLIVKGFSSPAVK